MELWQYASPFVAAAVASWTTFRFGIHGKRLDLAYAEVLAAFRIIKAEVLALKRYSEARAADIDGGDYEVRSDDLPAEQRRSFLEHHHALTQAVEEYDYVLTVVARSALEPVLQTLGLICSMQITMDSNDPAHLDCAASLYRQLADQIPTCVDELYNALNLPR